MITKMILHPATRERKNNLKQLKILINQYLPKHTKETLAKVKLEQ